MTFLLDTNTVIYLINDRLAMVLPARRYGVSVITEIELLSFPDLQADEEQRIRAFLAVADRVAISEPIRDQAITLRRLHRRRSPMPSSPPPPWWEMLCCSAMTES